MKEQFLWVEKYRPKKIQDCVLTQNLKDTFQEYVNQKEIPNLLLSGTAGVGKTTVARALCEEVGCDYIIINGSDEGRSIDVLRNTISGYASSVSLSGGRKVIIIDEADYLNAQSVQPALRGAIEEFSSNCSFIFTCNFKNRIMEAIHSRCTVIDFKLTNNKAKFASQFFKRVEYILNNENIKYEKEVVASVITKYFPDNRRVINELQRYSVSGVIDKGLLTNIEEANISELLKTLKSKAYSSVKKWVFNNIDNDPAYIFRKLYDSLYEHLTPQTVPQMVLIIGKYQYQAAFVADQEINTLACLTEIMVDCEFK
jgi:DNA polymerase III delta prime subunit